MTNSLSPSKIKYLLDKYDIRLTKSLGQNLLTDANIAEKIAHAAAGADDSPTLCPHVVEIGSGFGSLTIPLSKLTAKLTAVEIDARLIPLLDEVLSETEVKNVELINEDFLKYDIDSIDSPWYAAGNLPYNITTPIIMRILEQDNLPERMTFLVQKEAAKRITARPGGKDRGAVSVIVQYMCHTEHIMDVGPDVFFPKPKVESSLVLLAPKKQRFSLYENSLFRTVVKTAFSQRRKMLRGPLSSLISDKMLLSEVFKEAGVEETTRAETLTVEQFIKLTESFKHRIK